jgi:2-keto-3-deoxy-L-rhamnonate aldolase RhmA
MRGNDLKLAIKSGKRVYGGLVISPSPKWLKYVGKTGMDFVFIDTEHAAIDSTTLSWMCYAYRGINMAPIVRIPSHDPYLASKVIDGGADGIMIPYVETVEQVKALVGAVKYKPLKGKKLDGILNGGNIEKVTEDYIIKANANNILLINIESIHGINNLDKILKVPGLDGVVVGPHDLSCNMDIPEQYDRPEYENAVLDILRRTRAAGLGAGVHFMGNIDRQIVWAEKADLNMIFHSADLNVYVQTMKSDLDKCKAALGDSAPSETIKVNI